jgi:hypothetical protein
MQRAFSEAFFQRNILDSLKPLKAKFYDIVLQIKVQIL